jgi:hypothetical protein
MPSWTSYSAACGPATQATEQRGSKQSTVWRCSVVVELEAHAVMDLVISQRDVVLVHGVPLLNADLLRPRSCKM